MFKSQYLLSRYACEIIEIVALNIINHFILCACEKVVPKQYS